MLFTERNTFSCTRVLCIKRLVEYDIPPFATIRRLAKLLVACPSAIREIGPTNRSLRSTQGDTARSCKWPERPTRVVGAVAANVKTPDMVLSPLSGLPLSRWVWLGLGWGAAK